MTLRPSTAALLTLAATSLICSSAFFFLMNDPEGPNLLIVSGLALVLFLVSGTVFLLRASGLQRLALGILIQFIAAAGLYFLAAHVPATNSAASGDYKDAAYTINGQNVQLARGVAETPAAPGSASMSTTHYFGNELRTDLNGDGREDIAFILTQEGGGSGTFFYAVAALNTETGWKGSDGYLLGDRIAPQSTNLSQNPRQKYVVVFNYADRAPGEPMTTQPSIGKSVYLKLDPATMQWGIVMPDFEGEAR